MEPRLVRGLDYYVRTVYEVIDEGLGAQNSLLGGGRYDGLMEELGGSPTPGMGFAAGLDRMVMLLLERGAVAETPDAYIVALGGDCLGQAMALARDLRGDGLRVATDLLGGSAKSQFKRANRSGAPQVLVVGGDELERGVVTVKEMETGEQREESREGLAARLRRAGEAS
jgi:histidyl-tRNA synthetase